MAIEEKDLHRMVWPFGQWKDYRVVNIPLTYLRSYTRDTKDAGRNYWADVANAEIKRRHFKGDHTFITEHAVERFTQHFPHLFQRYLFFSGKQDVKSELRPGLITFMKLLFKKALNNGQTVKAEGNLNSGGNYHVRFRHFRWTYGLYGTGVKDGINYEYKIISVVPTNNPGNPLKEKKDDNPQAIQG
jgi:hypothetical protein